MMAAARIPSSSTRCRRCAGGCRPNAPLAPFTWFRVGGPADALVRPADEADLAQFLRALPLDIPVHVIGACSNLIIRDGGLPGVVIRLARGFGAIAVEADGVIAGARRARRDRRRTCRRGRTDRTGIPLRHSRQHRRRGGDERRRLWRRHRVLPRLGGDRHAHRRTAPPCRGRSRIRLSPFASAARRRRRARPAARAARRARRRSPRAWRRSAPRARPRSRCARAPAVPRSAIRPT